MGTLPRAKINDFYEQFKPFAVTFTKEVISVTGLLPKMVNLKCGSDFFPCVIYSTSFEEAKIVANNKSGLPERLQTTNNVVSVRFHFKIPSSGEQVAFLVPSRLVSSSPYGGSADMTLYTLQYSQRPPDDLIEIMGRILEANYHFSKSKEKMFVVSPDLMRKARLLKQDIGISSEGAIYGGVLREVAFGSARIITKGVPQSCLDKQCNIRLDFDDPQESFVIGGTISKFEQVVNHPDTAILTLIYAELVPMSYKVRLCDYMLTLRQISQKPPQEAVASPAPPPKAPEAPEAEAAAVDDAPSA